VKESVKSAFNNQRRIIGRAAWLWRHIKTGGMATGVAKMGGIAKKRESG
jgi:hypothetical protein